MEAFSLPKGASCFQSECYPKSGQVRNPSFSIVGTYSAVMIHGDTHLPAPLVPTVHILVWPLGHIFQLVVLGGSQDKRNAT